MNVSVSGVGSLVDHPTIPFINPVPVEAEQAAGARASIPAAEVRAAVDPPGGKEESKAYEDINPAAPI